MILLPCVNTQTFIDGLLTSYTLVQIFKAIYPPRKHNFKHFFKNLSKTFKIKTLWYYDDKVVRGLENIQKQHFYCIKEIKHNETYLNKFILIISERSGSFSVH